MISDSYLFILPLISAILILATMLVFIVRGKRSLLLYSVLLLQFVLLLWTLGQTIQFTSTKEQTLWLSLILMHAAMNLLPVSWLVFCNVFTGNKRIIGYKSMIPLIIFPILFFLLFITNNYHHLYFKAWHFDSAINIKISYSYGSCFWLYTVIAYVYMLAGIYMLAKYHTRQRGIAKKQSMVLIISPLASFIFSMVSSSFQFAQKNESSGNLDLTPTFFSIAMILFFVAAFRYRFLDLYHGALDRIFRNMNESTLLIDYYNCISTYNSSFEKNFGEFKRDVDVGIFTDYLRGIAEKGESTELILHAIEHGNTDLSGKEEFSVLFPQRKTFNVTIYRLFDTRKKYHTRIVTFHDVSDYKDLLEELNQKNSVLSNINRQLGEHLKTVEDLSVSNERNRIAREVHDTIGHTLTLLIMLLKAGTIELDTNPEKSKEKFIKAENIAQEGLQELRYSISSLLPRNMDRNSISNSIGNLIENWKNTSVTINFSILGQEIVTYHLPSSAIFCISDTLYNVCKEAITNSLRHGKATQINVILKFTDDKIKLYIVDNGNGCKNIIKNFGLSGMDNRIHKLNGIIKYGSDGENGFNIQVEVPIGGTI